MLPKLDFVLTYLSPAISFLLIAGIFLFQIFKKTLPSVKTLGNLIKIFIGFSIIFVVALSVLQYYTWKQNDVSKFLLPPLTSMSYILRYSCQHYLFTPLAAIIFALLVFWGIKSLNKKFNNAFFYDEESYLAALGILATSWPNCLIFLCLVIFLGIIFHLIFLCFGLDKLKRRGDAVEKTIAISVFSKQFSEPFRLSFLYFWLPSALLTLLLGGIISKYIGITQFNI